MTRPIKTAFALALAAAVLSACRGSGEWIDKLQAEPLYLRARAARDRGTCAALVPMEFGRTFPVPAKDGASFKTLYYPVTDPSGKAEIGTPVYEGRFARAASASDGCARIGAAAPRPLGPAVPPGLSRKGYDRAAAVLYASLDRAAALYARGGAPAGADKQALTDYLDAFQTIAEPGLLPDYYRLNPDFWEWLRRETGRSIPKP